MTKKIYDILPPEPFLPPEPPVALEKEKGPSVPKEKAVLPSSKKSWRVMVGGLILILAIAVGFRISKVEIRIWPETEAVTFQTKLAVHEAVQTSDFKNKIIPGEILEVEKTVYQEFLASDKTLKEAEGTIRLYNAYTTKSENWLTGTRFVSADGKLFKSKNKIQVPEAELKNGKIIPSYVDVPVIAAEPGSDYNIEPSHFSIVAFRGTPRYTKFYGESSQPMTGGGEVPQVTEEDLERAEAILAERVKREAAAALKSKVSTGLVFLKDTSQTEILETFSLVQPGAEVEKFNFQIKAKSTAIVFKKDDLDDFIERFIFSRIQEDKLIYPESLTIDFSPEIVNLETGKILLSLSFSATIYPKIDLEPLKKGLLRKSLAEAKIFLENQPQFIQTEIKFWPFWVKSVPKEIEKIEMEYPLISID